MNSRLKLIRKLCTLILLLATLSVVTSNSGSALANQPIPARDCVGEYYGCMADCGYQQGCDYHCEDVFFLCIDS
jgi:hypothetical protein